MVFLFPQLEEKQGKSVRSSEKFFKQLQEDASENIRKKKIGLQKKRKKEGMETASRLLL